MAKFSGCLLLLIMFSVPSWSSVVTRHQDGSTKLYVAETSGDFLFFKNNVLDVLNRIEEFDFKVSPETLKLETVQKSLLATHYRFKQYYEGVEIEGVSLAISIGPENQIVKIYNTTRGNLSDEGFRKNKVPLISAELAEKIVWEKLIADGHLMEVPIVNLVVQNSKSLRLIYKVSMSVDSPYGHWLAHVDAVTGDVLDLKEQSLIRKKRLVSTQNKLAKERKLRPYLAAIREFESKQRKSFLTISKSSNWVDGRALVFDPNPVTTLERSDLEDRTSSRVFEDAYRSVELKDLLLTNGTYSLEGPRVTISDFDKPFGSISSSDAGTWNYSRGDSGFNDAMTYHHLDQSLLYLESLGYTGDQRIFKRSLKADSDGANGQDNSFYTPSTKRLSFGHGCVDDNEDSDVILHELGHAINDHINSSWGGGDTGAMGEGFGDYWAGVYSATTQKGLDFKPNWVFKWDGHNKCWAGRILNAVDTKYDHSRNYYAHRRIGARQTDELWSTPIFQTFLELYKSGAPAQDLNAIIIEAQFGLGGSLKMRDMAVSIVATAKAMFPNKNYHKVYERHFRRHRILE